MTVLVETGLKLTASKSIASVDSVVCVGRIRDRTPNLLMAEQPFLVGKSKKRRAEFSSGRYFARQAMTAAGLPPAAVLSREDRSPKWPSGLRGSLTHSRDLVAAGVSASLSGLGIDLEQSGRLSEKAALRILVDAEAEKLRTLGADFRWLSTLVFSAKESVYKAIYPTAKLYIGYREVAIELDLEAATFTATYLGDKVVNRPLEAGKGAWGWVGDVVLTRFELGAVKPSFKRGER